MTLTKVTSLEIDILIDDQDKGTFFLGCTKCKKSTKDWNEFFDHLFSHFSKDIDQLLDMRTWEVRKK